MPRRVDGTQIFMIVMIGMNISTIAACLLYIEFYINKPEGLEYA